MAMSATHPIAHPVAPDVRLREPEMHRELPGASSGAVSADEWRAFQRSGYLVKRGLVDLDFECVHDYLWAHAPEDIVSRDDPASWLDRPHRKWREADAARIGRLARGSWKLRSPGPRGLGTEDFLLARSAGHPAVRRVAEQLLAAPLAPSRRVRGVYAVFPLPPGVPGRLGPHSDNQAAELSAMVFTHRVAARRGGFTLWPGSHARLHPTWDTRFGSRLTRRVEAFVRARDRALEEITPVEISGEAGDVVFWHPRLLHSAGVNYSVVDGDVPSVRVLIPIDFNRAGWTFYDDDEHGPGAKAQWWVDSRNFREDLAPGAGNLWDGWMRL